ncbi:MOSC domain-containing protein [Desulfovibrio sp. OttesenSCG-928-G15]|nr:MOSC domain-containing protein [Desulfovibrio sp. OttesenSCG-928-G15]
MGTIIAICMSKKKGTAKKQVESALLLQNHGLEGDAHAGNWHRQVSLLSNEKIEAFRAKGAVAPYGCFGENLVVSGFDFATLPVGTRLSCGEVLLEISQIGKECHDKCQIYHTMGECIMPTQGVFAVVLEGGTVRKGDTMHLVERPKEAPVYRAAVLTISDKGFAGERVDESGAQARRILEEKGYQVVHTAILPDEQHIIAKELRALADNDKADLILTSGGTGFSPRDITPEATLAVGERQCPGIAEAMRAMSMEKTKRAMLTRGVAVIRGSTLIINLPGSPRAVRECLECVIDQLGHGLDILTGADSECASKR